MEPTVVDPRHTGRPGDLARLGLIVWTVAAGLSVVPGLVIALSAVFLFDAPNSGENDIVWALAYGLGSAPLVALATLVLSLFALKRRTRRATVLALAPPILWLIYTAVMVGLLQTVCGGSFSC